MNTFLRKSMSLTRRVATSSAFKAHGLPRRQFSVASNLSSLIEREIAEEDPVDELPAGLAELKDSLSSKWTIVEGDSTSTDASGATVKMYRKDPTPTGGKVSVTFHCQDTVDDEEISGSVFGDGDEEEFSPPLQFMVTLSKGGKELKMNCISEDAKASVDGMIIHPNESSLDEIQEMYRGPVLDDLPEDVRDGLDEFLRDDCGVDEDVAAFVAMYSDHREQAEYLSWLNDLNKLVK